MRKSVLDQVKNDVESSILQPACYSNESKYRMHGITHTYSWNHFVEWVVEEKVAVPVLNVLFDPIVVQIHDTVFSEGTRYFPDGSTSR